MKQIFINLPVKDVEASMNFYTQLGFTVNPLFSFDDQKCMVWCDQVYLMLQSYQLFQPPEKKLPDTKQHATATFTLPAESLEKMHEIIENGLKAGGRETTPLLDEGFMQVRNIVDLDGHNWSIIFLDMEQFKKTKGRE